MPTYVASYELGKPDEHYVGLFEHLRSYPNWTHPLDTVWMLVTPKAARELVSDISEHVDAYDRVVVVESAGQGSWRHVGAESDDWLRQHL